MAQFLSQAWFDVVSQLNAQTGKLNLPPTLQTLIINITIEQDTSALLHLQDGKIHQGHADHAVSTIRIDQQTLKDIIQTGDTNIAIEAFMMGKIRIDGDMSAIMSLQSAKPSPEQKALFKEILSHTEF
ncbi:MULTISPECIES: SCP2 sterol-binding domain-containing protein [unclassified Moraxella]|uniref:SCP2 sterol-binding domain-containing protein n=1 Tax=unclassified Moraxella TaxID=2685852 RepID=UPI00359CCB79